MPSASKRQPAEPAVRYEHVTFSVDSYHVRVEADINRDATNPEYAYRDTQEQPLYQFLTHLDINGTCLAPGKRAGASCELTIYSDDNPNSAIYWKLRDVQLLDEGHAPVYRQYRGKRIPVYAPPKGIGSFGKQFGEHHWRGAVFVPPRFVTDLLLALGTARPLFLSLLEARQRRRSWLARIGLQTANPMDEE